MTSVSDIPDIVIGRLPIYLRALSQLVQQGQEITSSHELGQRLGISSAQIRKDLSHFGEFGKQGTGYNIAHLQAQLRQILRVDREWPMIVVGAGDLGRAIAHYGGFVERGFRVVGVFDNDPARTGQKVAAFAIQDTSSLPQFLSGRGVGIAILTVPKEAAQTVADLVVGLGIRAIWNFAPTQLTLPPDVSVRHENLAVGLALLSHDLKKSQQPPREE